MFCIKCGTQIPDSANFCVKCGVALSGVRPGEGGAAPAAVPSGNYAGFWRRVAAYAVDGLVIFVIAAVGAGVLMLGDSSQEAMELGVNSIYFLGGWLYFALMHSSEQQATLGKRAFGIKVTDLAGQRIGFGRATARYFATILSSLILLIGYFMAGFTKRRQALHDMIAGTLVVSRDATPESVGSGLGAPRISGGVLAVAILASSIPLVGIVAAIAIPAYQDYLIRSQVTEGLTLAVEHKVAVAEAVANGASFIDISSESLGLQPAAAASNYVESIVVVQGAVSITYGGQANDKLAGKSVVIVPGLSQSGDVIWTCGRAAVPAGVAPAFEDFAQYTDVEDNYLPASCRGA